MMKPSICIWSDISLADVRELKRCSSILQIKNWITAKQKFSNEDLSMREIIIVDLYLYAVLFTKEQNFNEEQTSAFYSILKKTHEAAIETSFGNLEETYSYFKQLLACHSVKRPPFCVHLFEVNEIKAIQDYILKTYFSHFKLYKYAFTPKIIMNVSIAYQGVVEEETHEEEEEINPEDRVEDRENNNEYVREEVEEETEKEEDSPAIKELKCIVESTLEDQINKLKLSVDQKLKTNEEIIMKSVSGNKDLSSPPKSARKGKKK